MGLFSDLLKGKVSESDLNKLKDTVKKTIGDVETGIKKAADNLSDGTLQNMKQAQEQRNAERAERAAAYAAEQAKYETMPAEENQYNYGGDYKAYFSQVFNENFPGYGISSESTYQGRATVFTFTQGGAVRLKVELLSETSSVQKLRKECEAQGIAYLRFYYNHEGWWNTKSYVVDRVRNALG